ncbi:MAG: dipicolinate synthase, partial [Lachnospiraceae bacterium]
MKKLDVVVIGKERRTACMAQVLSEQGLTVEYFADGWGPDGVLQSARAVAGGIPFSEEEKALQSLQPGQFFFGGMLSKAFEKKCKERGIFCFDFMKEETVAVYNAIATAEGTIAEAIKGQETNLHGSECLVLGYGRCGRVLCDKLKGMSAKVTAASCEEVELAWAGAHGFDTLELSELSGRIQRYEYIFNTIPKVILDGGLLEKTRQDVLIVDIASGEGGVDYRE